jgi:chorismate dehydratase
MLAHADAALLIGDPALLAREQRDQIEAHIDATFGPTPLLWLDLAALWRQLTGLPWVAAVWAVRPESLATSHITPAQLTEDLTNSRDHGLAHIEDLVHQWTPRLPIPPGTIREYLTHNIHYTLDPACIETIHLFRHYAAEADILPPLPTLRLL